MAEIEFLLALTAEVVDSIDSTGCCCEVDGDEGDILGDPLEIGSSGGDCCSPAGVDGAPDSAGCDDCSCCWLKGVRVAFSLEEGPPESSSGCCERSEADLMAIAAAVGTDRKSTRRTPVT